MLQVAIFEGFFYIMPTILGLRGATIRGDFLVCIMTRIFLFMTHTKALTAVIASEGPASAIRQHATVNTIISIMAAALGLALPALKPWFPTGVAIMSVLCMRANMIMPDKLFVANSLPSFMLAMFD